LWNAEENDRSARGLVLAAVERALTAAAPVPGGAPLLLLYLKLMCDQAWEEAWDVDLLLTAMRFAARRWSDIVAARPPADPELTSLALGMLAVLESQMATFNAGACGTLAAWARYAAETGDLARGVTEAAARCGRSPVADLVAAEARGDAVYYAALAAAAQAVHDHFDNGEGDLAGAVLALRAAEESYPDGIERSELRAHRYNLEVLAAAAGQRWLRLNHAKVVYLYPFGLYEDPGAGRPGPGAGVLERDGATFAEQMVNIARRTGERWTVAGWSIGNHPNAEVARDFLLDDMWKGDDPLGRQYRGMAISLPDIELPDIDRDGEEAVTLRVELRLSELGNHYLRVECELSEATPPQVYAAMSRAAPEFGDLVQLGTPLRAAGFHRTDRTWRRLSDFATDVISDVSAQLTEHSGLAVRRSGRPGLYHVMVRVDRVSLVSPAGAEPVPVAIALDALTAIGAQPLCHPVRNGFSSLAEWLRYPVEVGELPIVDAPGFVGDLWLRTCNTTLVVMPGTPEYGVGGMLEAAEFVATVEGMFAGWQDQIAEHYNQLKAQLAGMIARLETGETPPDPAALESVEYQRSTQELVEMQADLEAQQLRLHQFVMGSQLGLMFVTAPSLVMSPVVRLTIDRLLAAAKFDALRGEFEGMIDKVLGDRIGALVDASVRRQQERNNALLRAMRERQEAQEKEEAARRERQERANRRRNDVLVGGMAAIGVSGVMQIVQAGYNVRGLYAVVLVAVVFVLAVLAGWILNRLHLDSANVLDERRQRSLPVQRAELRRSASAVERRVEGTIQ
jgi:hypothetical protein